MRRMIAAAAGGAILIAAMGGGSAVFAEEFTCRGALGATTAHFTCASGRRHQQERPV